MSGTKQTLTPARSSPSATTQTSSLMWPTGAQPQDWFGERTSEDVGCTYSALMNPLIGLQPTPKDSVSPTTGLGSISEHQNIILFTQFFHIYVLTNVVTFASTLAYPSRDVVTSCMAGMVIAKRLSVPIALHFLRELQQSDVAFLYDHNC